MDSPRKIIVYTALFTPQQYSREIIFPAHAAPQEGGLVQIWGRGEGGGFCAEAAWRLEDTWRMPGEWWRGVGESLEDAWRVFGGCLEG